MTKPTLLELLDAATKFRDTPPERYSKTEYHLVNEEAFVRHDRRKEIDAALRTCVEVLLNAKETEDQEYDGEVFLDLAVLYMALKNLRKALEAGR